MHAALSAVCFVSFVSSFVSLVDVMAVMSSPNQLVKIDIADCCVSGLCCCTTRMIIVAKHCRCFGRLCVLVRCVVMTANAATLHLAMAKIGVDMDEKLCEVDKPKIPVRFRAQQPLGGAMA